MYKEYHPKGIEFVGISMDTNVEAWQKAIVQYGIEYPQVSELKKFKETDIAKAYGVNWIPSMVVIGPDGKVKLSTVLSYKVDKYLKEQTSPKQRGQDERLTIDGSKGKLQAIIQKPELKQGEQCPMVIFCHGFGGTKDGPMFELIADTLQQHGSSQRRLTEEAGAGVGRGHLTRKALGSVLCFPPCWTLVASRCKSLLENQ